MKKRFLALLLVLTMVFSLMPAALAADTLSGSGTEDDPYLLATAADLKAFRDMANAEASSKLCATLTADIDLGGEAWTPFEPSSGYVSQAYAGTFDGANHTIKGLSVNLTSSTGAGLFGTVCGATIKNLRVEGNVSASSSVSVGGIVGRTQTSATIDSCSFAGTVTSTKKNGAAGTAGIVGRVNAGTLAVTNCANLSDVTGSGSAAGILAMPETPRLPSKTAIIPARSVARITLPVFALSVPARMVRRARSVTAIMSVRLRAQVTGPITQVFLQTSKARSATATMPPRWKKSL